MKNYCIREDYVARDTAETYVDDPVKYWNKARISTSGYYQYYVYKKAAEIAGNIEDCSFVDIGCGYPRKAKEIIHPIVDDITLIDQPSMKEFIEKRFPEMKFLPLNLENELSEVKGRFNCAVCADVIEHLLNPDTLLSFIKKIMTSGGILIISTPERNVLRGINCLYSPMAEHVREWNFDEFAEYLGSSGFEIIEHLSLPQGKLTWIEEALFPVIKHLKFKRYNGCQAVVCKLR